MKASTIIVIMSLIQACNLFDKDERLLFEHKKSNGERIQVYYVGLGAATNDVIQVRQANLEKPLWVSDKYNYLKSSTLVNDTSLQLILSDTGYHNYANKPDTIFVNIR